MKGVFLALAVLLGLAFVGEAQAFGGRTVVRRGVFGRTVVVQRGFAPHVNRDQFGRTVIIR